MHLGCMHYADRRTARGYCGAELLLRDGDGVGDMCTSGGNSPVEGIAEVIARSAIPRYSLPSSPQI
eukprot:2610934-Prymnesium_polylepis.1